MTSRVQEALDRARSNIGRARKDLGARTIWPRGHEALDRALMDLDVLAEELERLQGVESALALATEGTRDVAAMASRLHTENKRLRQLLDEAHEGRSALADALVSDSDQPETLGTGCADVSCGTGVRKRIVP